MEYKPKLEKIDIKKANSYLSEQTLNFGNRTVITSAFLLLISLNFLSINGIEIEGISISINTSIITLVLIVVNYYYYNQFLLASEVDNSSNLVPLEYEQFKSDISTLIVLSQKKLDFLLQEQKEINDEFNIINTTDEKKQKLLEKLNIVRDEMQINFDIIERSSNAIKIDAQKVNQFITTVKKYNRLNIQLPKIIYFISLISVLFRFCIYSYQVFSSQSEPWNYMLENELSYYKVIFEEKK